MFKPTLDNFSAALQENSTNVANFSRCKAVIESDCEVVDPYFAFVPSLEHMHMNSFRQIVTIKADAITVLKEHRWHRYVFFTNTLPGNCRSSRFISSPSRATETAEAGKPLRRMMSSMATSSLSIKS
jgi:hypothetical protein